uniref:Ephrin RBD domain-containing protein n=1 Tax=Panagrellus redivivus TaxID=6233 RepID=A0A7E4UYL5_PANRE
MLRLLLIFHVTLTMLVQLSETADVVVDWAPESVLFNKGHLITKKFVKMRDQVVFDCPEDMPISILMVTKEEAINCDVTTRYNTSLVGLCTPERKRINFVVRDFSLLPNVPIFKEGEEYFFISTSNGTVEGMRNPAGGFCAKYDMRLALKVSGRAAGRSDVNRNPDILMLFAPVAVPSTLPTEEFQHGLNRVVTPKVTTPKPTMPSGDTTYPAYVVFPDRLSIIVQSEKELQKVIDAYMETHRPPTRDYNIFPVQGLKLPNSDTWERPSVPSRNTEYEIQGTASPLSSDHVPTFEVKPDLSHRRRKIEEERKNRSRFGSIVSSIEASLPFDYEIGYEDGLNSGHRVNGLSSLLPVCISLLIFRLLP